jgi:SEC-C motif domain protein
MVAATNRSPCPCGGLPKGASYEQCCGRFHRGELYAQAPTPEALMRSRYSAYVRRLREYLHDTWHASTRPTELLRFDADDKWLGLEIRDAPQANADATEGLVEFIARSRPAGGGAAQRLHERSRFVKEAGRWLYVDGKFPKG